MSLQLSVNVQILVRLLQINVRSWLFVRVTLQMRQSRRSDISDLTVICRSSFSCYRVFCVVNGCGELGEGSGRLSVSFEV